MRICEKPTDSQFLWETEKKRTEQDLEERLEGQLILPFYILVLAMKQV